MMSNLNGSISCRADFNTNSRRGSAKPFLPSYTATQLLAIAIGVFPFYGFIIWAHLTKEQPYSLEDLFYYPLIVGGFAIIWMLFIFKSFCGEKLSNLNLRYQTWKSDLLVGIVLALLAFAWRFFEQVTIANWIQRNPPAPEILNLLFGIAENPWLLALWLGPVAWIGVAAFEELSRVFLLNRLWALSPAPLFKWSALLFSALLFGLAHIYQGSQGAISVGIIGLIWGLGYLLTGRIWPLILAHGIFDSVQVGLAIIEIRSAL